MKFPDSFRQQLKAFPASLRELVEAEFNAGDSIVTIENGLADRTVSV